MYLVLFYIKNTLESIGISIFNFFIYICSVMEKRVFFTTQEFLNILVVIIIIIIIIIFIEYIFCLFIFFCIAHEQVTIVGE